LQQYRGQVMDVVPPRRKARPGRVALPSANAEVGFEMPASLKPLPKAVAQEIRALAIACIAFSLPFERVFGSSTTTTEAVKVRTRNVRARRRGGGPQ
jgi:hypothetical protein